MGFIDQESEFFLNSIHTVYLGHYLLKRTKRANIFLAPQRWKLKKDIVRTYISGDICPHYVRTTSHEGYMSFSRWPRTRTVRVTGHEAKQWQGIAKTGGFPPTAPPHWPQPFFAPVSDGMCVLPPWKRHTSLVRCWDLFLPGGCVRARCPVR